MIFPLKVSITYLALKKLIIQLDFADSYIENYSKRLEIFKEALIKIEEKLSEINRDDLYETEQKKLLIDFLRKYIFLYKFPLENEYHQKLFKYYIAHVKFYSLLIVEYIILEKIFI